jgi:hypothetical protein
MLVKLVHPAKEYEHCIDEVKVIPLIGVVATTFAAFA